MPQVTVADVTHHFGANHAVRMVGFFAHIVAINRHKIAWPAAARIKFCVRGEQGRATADAAIDAMLVVIPKTPRKRPFSAFLTWVLMIFFILTVGVQIFKKVRGDGVKILSCLAKSISLAKAAKSAMRSLRCYARLPRVIVHNRSPC